MAQEGVRLEADQEMWVLRQKHTLALRWFHWINFPVILTMVWSGLLIFWANHQGSIAIFGHQVFPESFFQPHAPSWWPLWLPHMVDSSNGKPEIFLYSLQYRLAEGMYWHFLFFWFFTLNGLAYVGYLAFSGEWRRIVPLKDSFSRSIQVALHDVHLIKKEPARIGIYNHAQRIAYTGVILLGIVMLVSGLAIYKPTQLYWLVRSIGGYRFARWIHFWTTILICAFFLVHVLQVVKSGWANFRSMLTGHDIEKVRIPTKDESSEGAA